MNEKTTGAPRKPREPTKDELLAELALLRQQLADLSGGDGAEPAFVPSDLVDAADVGEIQRTAAESQRQEEVAAHRFSGTHVTHEVDHTHDVESDGTDLDRETEVLEWHDPSNLEAPPPRKGMVQRWIRASFRAGDDPGNIIRARREGWRPRPVSSVDRSYAPATIHHKILGEVIAVEGLILCEMPINVARQRYNFYRKLLAAQNEAITRDVHRDERPGHPIIAERRSTVTRGRAPQVGD